MCRPRHMKRYTCGARGIRAEGFDRRALAVLVYSTRGSLLERLYLVIKTPLRAG